VARTINQSDLARLAGVTQETISKAERGLLRLSPDVQARLAVILGVSIAELFPPPDRQAVA
jgi:transcriptional regulator with XRE-family HTH domain